MALTPVRADAAPPAAASLGDLLRAWRAKRRLSQLELGLRAGVSPRHISFIETGRSRASAELLVALSDVLDLPLRERNALLLAGGHAPRWRETPLDAPDMAAMRQAMTSAFTFRMSADLPADGSVMPRLAITGT